MMKLEQLVVDLLLEKICLEHEVEGWGVESKGMKYERVKAGPHAVRALCVASELRWAVLW